MFSWWLSGSKIHHEREVYNVMDLLGDLGGVVEVLMIIFGFFLFPISEFSFITSVTQKLFYARTT